MAELSETGEGLLTCLREVSGLLRAAHAAAQEEQQALVANDADRLARSCRTQDEILRRIAEVDQRAAELATRMAEALNMDFESVQANEIARGAGPPLDSLIPSEIESIANLAVQVKESHEVIARLLGNGLEVVSSCLRSLACESSPPSYSESAAYMKSQPQIISVDNKA